MALSMMNSDMILKSCKVMMTCVRTFLSFYKVAWCSGYSEQSSRTVNDKHKKKWNRSVDFYLIAQL